MTSGPIGIPAKMHALHTALAAAAIPHAFGGALALAWCTRKARGTIDVDINLFVGPERTDDVIEVLPAGVTTSETDRMRLERDGQVRLWWDETPVDVFLNTTAYHDEVATRVRWERFAGADLPFLACQDLAVFKAFFDRTRDWADLEEMAAGGSLDTATVAGTLARHLGADDQRIARLLALG